VIFLTVGTQLPFDRLVAAVDAWAGARGGASGGVEVFGQIADPGPAGYRPKHFPWVADLDPAAFEARFRAATHIVGHAGMGTIIGALGQRKPLLVMPRRAHLGEQRNDHQFATVQRLRNRPGIARSGILAAFEADEVPGRMEALLARAAAGAVPGRANETAEDGARDGAERGAESGAAAAPIARFAEKRLTDAIRAAILG
jgi:UDP-N-acetylglucosamine transferase subunit ALG13